MGIVAALIAVASVVVLWRGNDSTSREELMQNCLQVQQYSVQTTDGDLEEVAFEELSEEQQEMFRSKGLDPETHCTEVLRQADAS
ncbi:MAG: hypothetical protein ACRELV_14500 [Longimicrobiales bacterium]